MNKTFRGAMNELSDSFDDLGKEICKEITRTFFGLWYRCLCKRFGAFFRKQYIRNRCWKAITHVFATVYRLTYKEDSHAD